MDVEGQVISLVGELDAGARDRVLTYLTAKYQAEPEGAKVARKVSAARVGRVIKAAEKSTAITVAEAAKATRVQKAKVYAWIKSGKLKTTKGAPYRDGYASLVRVADIQALQEA